MPWLFPKPPVCTAPVLLGLALALATGCGPSTREASIAVLVVAGAVVVLANALAGVLWLLWRRLRPELDFRWQPFATIGLVLSGVGLLAEAQPYAGAMTEWLGLALGLMGTSYLSLFLLVWRIRLPAPNGLAWAHAIAGAVMFLPALWFAFTGPSQGDLIDALFFLWVLPGYAGFVAGPIYAVLLLEVVVRWRMALAKQDDAAAREG